MHYAFTLKEVHSGVVIAAGDRQEKLSSECQGRGELRWITQIAKDLTMKGARTLHRLKLTASLDAGVWLEVFLIVCRALAAPSSHEISHEVLAAYLALLGDISRSFIGFRVRDSIEPELTLLFGLIEQSRDLNRSINPAQFRNLLCLLSSIGYFFAVRVFKIEFQ
jgi:hypothetical protein